MRAVKCVVGTYVSVVDDNECNAATKPTDTQVNPALLSPSLPSVCIEASRLQVQGTSCCSKAMPWMPAMQSSTLGCSQLLERCSTAPCFGRNGIHKLCSGSSHPHSRSSSCGSPYWSTKLPEKQQCMRVSGLFGSRLITFAYGLYPWSSSRAMGCEGVFWCSTIAGVLRAHELKNLQWVNLE